MSRALRLKEGLSGEELSDFCKRFIPDEFVNVYSMDNIDYELIKQRLSQGKASCCIVNTSRASEKGEHWVGIHFSSQGDCEYFDSFGLPPIQRGVQRLCELSPSGYYDWNEAGPVQDALDNNGIACGYHVLFFLHVKHETGLSLHEIVHKYYTDSLSTNDLFAIVFIENKMME